MWSSLTQTKCHMIYVAVNSTTHISQHISCSHKGLVSYCNITSPKLLLVDSTGLLSKWTTDSPDQEPFGLQTPLLQSLDQGL